jgi:hypothetical protein
MFALADVAAGLMPSVMGVLKCVKRANPLTILVASAWMNTLPVPTIGTV